MNELLNKLGADYGYADGVTLEGLRIQSLITPRESFKQTASKVAKHLLKQWP